MIDLSHAIQKKAILHNGQEVFIIGANEEGLYLAETKDEEILFYSRHGIYYETQRPDLNIDSILDHNQYEMSEV